MPIEQIQKFLGHSKLETTQIYAESSTEMIRGELSAGTRADIPLPPLGRG